MAVQNYLANFQFTEDGIENDAIHGHGVPESYAQSTINPIAGDSAGSTYCILKNIPADAVIDKIEIETDAIAGLTSLSIGIYDSVTGAAIAPNAYLNAATMATAAGKNAPLDGLGALTHDQTLQQVFVLAGATLLNKKGNYDLVATSNSGSTGAGFITFRMRLIPSG